MLLPPSITSRPAYWDGFKMVSADTHSRLAFLARNDCLSPTSVGPDWAITATGTGTSWTQTAVGTNNAVGILRGNVGTTTTGDVLIEGPYDSGLLLGQYHAYFATRVRFNNLSNGTNRYTFNAGFRDSAIADGVMFRYIDNVNSGRFECNIYNNSSLVSNQNSGITVAANTWYLLEVFVAGDGRSAIFMIDGVVRATVVNFASIPTAAGRELNYGVRTLRSLGSLTFDTIDVDFVNVALYFATPR